MKKKRFTSKEEIEKEIDRLKQRSQKYFAQAEADEEAAVRFYRSGCVSTGNDLIDIAHKRRRRAMNILEKKLPQLGEKMAEFLTLQLPGVDNGDTSIPAF